MTATLDIGAARRLLYRSPWDAFPDVCICAAESSVKQHALYAAAKEGDARRAEGLVEDILAEFDAARAVSLCSAAPDTYLLPVHALETEGMNVIPRVMARMLGARLDLPVYTGVVQVNRVSHTGSSGYHRLAFPAVFEGMVASATYILVDDFVGQGGTLANLRGYVEHYGGRVRGAISLTGKAYSAKLKVEASTLDELRTKHGERLEEWWATAFGYRFERLTESEARYLIRSDNADRITEELVAARGA